MTRFEHDDLPNRLLILLQCFIAAVMAANAKDALDSRSSAGFGAAYAGMRIILVVQYLRARRIAETRELTTRYAAGFGAAALLWIVSALLDVPERYWVWGAALIVDFATPWLSAKHTVRFPPDASHYPERFGLFTIILLGEFIAGVMRGIESQEYWSLSAATTAFSSMAFAFIVRWWYFDIARGANDRHIRSKHQAVLFDVWQYVHLPLFLGVAVAGVGFQQMISPEGEGAWILGAAVALLTACLALIGSTTGTPGRRVAGQIGLALVALGAAAIAADLPRVLFVIVLLAICGFQTLLGVQPRATAVRQAAA
jgi:low temperature requirement protein LtrA